MYKELEVLIEETEDNYSIGHTSNYICVKANGSVEDINTIKKVKLKEIDYPIMK